MEGVDVYDIKKIKLDKTPRPAQIKLLEFIKESIKSNHKGIIVDAPVGIGKSYMAVMFMDWFKKNFDISANFDVLTNSKILQEQYTQDFDFMNSLWGKGSYHCDTYDTDCGTGGEWCRIQNKKCEACPYSTAKYRFENGDVALTNFHLFLTYMVYMPQAWKRSSRVLIIDEAHSLEEVLCDFITTKISKPLLKRNGFTDQEAEQAMWCFGENPENMALETFIEIVNESFLPIVKTVINRLAREAEETKSMQAINFLQGLTQHHFKWENLGLEVQAKPNNWILEAENIYKNDKKTGKVIDKYIEFTAQPVWASEYLEEKVWSRYDFILFMSGTILNKELFCQINGLNIEDTAYIQMDSPFPVENRPIYYFSKLGKQTFATKELTWGKQKTVLEKILKKYKNEKGIVHTANYEIQKWVHKEFEHTNRLLAHDSTNRSELLQEHYNSEEPTVLVSPSLMTGIDLADDYSRHQTILKIPYPNLKSQKVKKRMETNKDWYSWRTAVDMQQSYGRSIRSMEDHADTYMLDGSFTNFLKYSRKFLLDWVVNAIQFVD